MTGELSAGERSQLEVLASVEDASLRRALPMSLSDIVDARRKPSDDAERRGRLVASGQFVPPVTVGSLATAENWTDLRLRLVFASASNHGPLNRILSILHDCGVKSVVTEPSYVCLDYRSEFSSFYAQLDAPPDIASVRLHFFRTDLSSADTDVFNLEEEESSSYAGYVVVRGGGLPIVGRTMIMKPDYIDEAPTVEERVHFFGQILMVEGVPFMQQDERFAVCSHVAAWITHYSAVKRGLTERRFVADFVTQLSHAQPLRPSHPSGLHVQQVSELLSQFGMRTESFTTALDQADLPPTPVSVLTGGQDLLDELGRVIAASGVDEDVDWPQVLERAKRDVNPVVLEVLRRFDELDGRDVVDVASRLHSLVIDHVCRPFLRSRWPIYLGTGDHALVFSGRSEVAAGLRFFYHDDQFGPYLVADQALLISKDLFRYQAHLDFQSQDADHLLSEPPADRARMLVAPGGEAASGDQGPSFRGFTDTGRAVINVLVPAPARLLLDPGAALLKAIGFAQAVNPAELRAEDLRVTIVMGVDYKDQRRNWVTTTNPDDRQAVGVYSSVHLAEWVVLVEHLVCVDERPRVDWEFVFDGTSGSTEAALVQLARWDRSLTMISRRTGETPVLATIGTSLFEPVQVRSRLGKGI